MRQGVSAHCGCLVTIATLRNQAELPPSPFDLSDFQGNVEIETYWLKGKRDKDGNAQAACPQFETQTISKAISKATISGPETAEDGEGLVRNTNIKEQMLRQSKQTQHQPLTFSQPFPTLSTLQIFPAAAGEDEDDVKSIRSHRMKMEISGHSLEESLEECRVEEMSIHKVSSGIC